MTDQPRASLVLDAITALSAFESGDTDTILSLLGTWTRRDELSVADIRAILAHYRAAPGAEAAPSDVAAPIVVATLTETDPAPAGAVRGRDNDGDDWEPAPDGQWRYVLNGTACSTRRLVRTYGPIDWYNASDNLIAVSHAGDAR